MGGVVEEINRERCAIDSEGFYGMFECLEEKKSEE